MGEAHRRDRPWGAQASCLTPATISIVNKSLAATAPLSAPAESRPVLSLVNLDIQQYTNHLHRGLRRDTCLSDYIGPPRRCPFECPPTDLLTLSVSQLCSLFLTSPVSSLAVRVQSLGSRPTLQSPVRARPKRGAVRVLLQAHTALLYRERTSPKILPTPSSAESVGRGSRMMDIAW